MSSSPAHRQKPLQIGMIGAGTVGGGVYEIIMGRLRSQHQRLPSMMDTSSLAPSKKIVPHHPSMGPSFIISKICVRDRNKTRNFHIDKEATTIVTDIHSIIHDKDIDIVVDAMGDCDLSRFVVLESLQKGKSVVSANKFLIAYCMDEIRETVLKVQGLAQQQQREPREHHSHSNSSSSGVRNRTTLFGYEAAVCSGIPIIQSLQTSFSGDIIHEIMGICNGTTNYILCKMEQGADYEEALKEAQELGCSEADISADVQGYDVRAKIAILSKLAFGTTVHIDSIPCMGISEISSVDFEYAKLLGCTIKLIGTAERLSDFGEHDGDLSVYVAPKLIPTTHLLSNTRGVDNTIAIKSANLGVTSYSGPGAGRFPTANSIVADICRIASNTASLDPFPLARNIGIDNDYSSAFYIRITFHDELGIIRRVGELAEMNGVSICSVLQNPIKNRMSADFVVTTEECKYSQVEQMCQDIGRQEFAHNIPIFMPMLSEYGHL
mmetsp:Transcript_2938/g.5504  ORF Transcript_2938/g.5504 Transcript_2938/m.5504 type:complete len:493 (-) Transcript_2938:1081-2559(-)|eukprot:CAMPEP_0176483198 /NCGR_PEP_ID=MMETSP0200_2-20121128/3792_1 /TAXON_ID=947934 /ORGANISM="Chaetoceros sp., Strain GSL56" /LENGTH=492 /DNA_ID=CAMNT_0017879587 /DNA_START=63 /DNA_END=1541 /DNA_ORIENTATION=+